MSLAENWLAEAQSTVVAGMDRGRDPELIGDQAFAYGLNVTTRGGRPRSRPRYVRRATLPEGALQGGKIFSVTGGMLVSIAGAIHDIELGHYGIVERTSEDDRNNADREFAYFCETDGSIVIQDGRGYAFVWDGSAFSRNEDIPIGTCMSYGSGRLAVAVGPDGTRLRIGDIRQGHQSELKFTEANSFVGGGDLSFSSRITALAHIPVVDTTSGVGPLVVGQADKIWSVHTEIAARKTWSSIDGFQTILFPRHGISGPNALVEVNQDLYFRSVDGLRSLRLTASDYSSAGSTPISSEVAFRLGYDFPALLPSASCAYFDNRLLITHSPRLYGATRGIHDGMISLNCETLSSMGNKSSPAYDGEWYSEEFRIVQLVSGESDGVPRCFALVVEADGANALWELLKENEQIDNTVGSYTVDDPLQAIETRVFNGKAGGLKQLCRADLWFSQISEEVSVSTFFRADKRSSWVPWDAWTIVPKVQNENRARISTSTPPETIDEQNLWPVCLGEGFQFRIAWRGFARLDKVIAFLKPVPESKFADNGNVAEEVEVISDPIGGAGSSTTDNGSTVTDIDYRITVLESSVSSPTTGLPAAHARISTEESTRASADSALTGSVSAQAALITAVTATANSTATGLAAAVASVTAEQTARVSADNSLNGLITAQATNITAVQAQVNDPTTGLANAHARVTTEETARASAVGVVQGQVTAHATRLTAVETVAANAQSRITTEESARIAADNSINGSVTSQASRITTLETSVNDPTSGLARAHSKITTEESARTNADNAIQGSVTSVASRATSLESALANPTTGLSAAHSAITSEASTRVAAVNSLQGQITTQAGQITTISSQVTTAQTAATNAATSAAAAATAASQVTTEATTRAAADTALQGQITTQASSITTIASQVTTAQTAATNAAASATAAGTAATAAAADAATAVSTANAASSAVTTEATTRASADTNLQNQVTTQAALITTVQSTANTASTNAANAATSASNASAAVTSEAATRASADGNLQGLVNAHGSRLTATEAVANTASTNASGALTAITTANARITTEENARVAADNALATSISTVSASVATTNSNVTALAATVTTEASARASGDATLQGQVNSQASLITTVTASAATANTLAGNAMSTASGAQANAAAAQLTASAASAAVSSEASARASADGNLAGKYTLKVIAGNVITGMNITSQSGGGTDVSEFTIQADVFKIKTATTTKVPFTVTGDVVKIDGVAFEIGSGNENFYVANGVVKLGRDGDWPLVLAGGSASAGQRVVEILSGPTHGSGVPFRIVVNPLGSSDFETSLWMESNFNVLAGKTYGAFLAPGLMELSEGSFTRVHLSSDFGLVFFNDTNLYRLSANVLKTDDAFVVGGALNVTGAVTLTSGITGALAVSGAIDVASVADSYLGTHRFYSAGVEVGERATGDRYAIIDLHGDDTNTDYALRIIRNNSGVNAASEIRHKGTGALRFITEGAAIHEFYNAGALSGSWRSDGIYNAAGTRVVTF